MCHPTQGVGQTCGPSWPAGRFCRAGFTYPDRRLTLRSLQPDVHPGKCWAFPGSQGHALIKLARKIIPMAVTVEHISERVSPSGNITSAPQEFSVYVRSCRNLGSEWAVGQGGGLGIGSWGLM